jgi:hypothetical protein
MHIAVKLDEIGKQHQRAFHALNQGNLRWLWRLHDNCRSEINDASIK